MAMTTTTATIKARYQTKGALPMKCPHCSYEFKPRVEKPKKCPLCQKWINKPKPKGN